MLSIFINIYHCGCFRLQCYLLPGAYIYLNWIKWNLVATIYRLFVTLCITSLPIKCSAKTLKQIGSGWDMWMAIGLTICLHPLQRRKKKERRIELIYTLNKLLIANVECYRFARSSLPLKLITFPFVSSLRTPSRTFHHHQSHLKHREWKQFKNILREDLKRIYIFMCLPTWMCVCGSETNCFYSRCFIYH